MGFWLFILIAVAVIFVLTWVGATMTKRPPGQGRRRRSNDYPIVPGPSDDHPFL